MVVCLSCGAYLSPPYRFCPRCGRPVPEQLPYPPAVAYLPPKKDNTALIIVLVVILVIAIPVVFAGVLYLMVSPITTPLPGPGPGRPTVTMTVTRITNGVSILVAGIRPSTAPSNFKVNMQNATSSATGTPVAAPTTAGGSGTCTTPSATCSPVTVSGLTFSITWQNPSGSGVVSQGDTFVIIYNSAPPSGTSWNFLLIWNDGSVVGSANWSV